MRTLRTLCNGVVCAAIWPAYLLLAAYAVRQGPWPLGIAEPLSSVLVMLALAALVENIVRWVLARSGWAEEVLGMPGPVTKQLRRASLGIVCALVLFVGPVWLITTNQITNAGHPVQAPATTRLLILAFGLTILAIACRLLRPHSPLLSWLAESPSVACAPLARHRRACGAAMILGIAAMIALDAWGYSYSAHRLATGAAGSLALAALAWACYRVVLQVIDEHAWRWVKCNLALASPGDDTDPAMPDDLVCRLQRLTAYLAFGVWVLGAAKCWDVDLDFLRTVGATQLWPMTSGKLPEGAEIVSLGDVAEATLLIGLTLSAWRHLATFFAVVIFPRMPDDPGVRFAALTLSRYFVLGFGLICGLSTIHLGLDKIGMVLAALGVGLGFGLQEVVSNFVCGVILLLERPIRVGDIVTVSGMNGKVDRIHIRATTIVNGDNQSIIVPNRAFITGDLINWTLRDKVVRLTIKLTVAYGNDPDLVAETLLSIARDDPDVLRNPAPSALVEEMTSDGLAFVLHAHVPDPSLSGRVKHRLVRGIQRRFEAEHVELPMPTQKLLVDPADMASFRVDPGSSTPPAPLSIHMGNVPRAVPAPVEDCNRGVDE
jgi:small-conductance mechanosensitive channel